MDVVFVQTNQFKPSIGTTNIAKQYVMLMSHAIALHIQMTGCVTVWIFINWNVDVFKELFLFLLAIVLFLTGDRQPYEDYSQ